MIKLENVPIGTSVERINSQKRSKETLKIIKMPTDMPNLRRDKPKVYNR